MTKTSIAQGVASSTLAKRSGRYPAGIPAIPEKSEAPGQSGSNADRLFTVQPDVQLQQLIEEASNRIQIVHETLLPVACRLPEGRNSSAIWAAVYLVEQCLDLIGAAEQRCLADTKEGAN